MYRKNKVFEILIIDLNWEALARRASCYLDISHKKLHTICCVFCAIQPQYTGILDVKMAYMKYPAFICCLLLGNRVIV